jgi:hypothetical protein
MGSVLGSILDPAADKFLMTVLTVTLTAKGLLPRLSQNCLLSFSQGCHSEIILEQCPLPSSSSAVTLPSPCLPFTSDTYPFRHL